jgi:DNA mismatch endonuclease (patch repair protein)
MSRIKSFGNKSTEMRFRAALSAAGVSGWSIQPEMTGHPDIAFLPPRVAVFLDGCFWHGCEDHFKAPKTNRAEWVRKIDANKRRDAKTLRELLRESWKVFRIWEHDIADEPTLKGIVLRVARAADTPDSLEFGRPIERQSDAPDRHRLLVGRPGSHPLMQAGGFHTVWHKLFTEGGDRGNN